MFILKKEYVAENKVWEQFEPGVNSLGITKDFAERIAEALNDVHLKQREAIVKQMEGYRAALKGLESEEDLSYADLRKSILNEDQYHRRIQQIRDQRDDYNRQIQNLNLAITDAGMVSVKKVFELAINAKALWKSMNQHQRMDYLKKVCSNPTLDGLTLRYELQKPFARLAAWKENSKWRRGRDCSFAFCSAALRARCARALGPSWPSSRTRVDRLRFCPFASKTKKGH